MRISFFQKPDRKTDLEKLGVDGRIMIKYIFKAWNGLTWLMIRTAGGRL
jgi:hypothetical protein